MYPTETTIPIGSFSMRVDLKKKMGVLRLKLNS